jgi:hypothetical protein
MAAYLHSYHRNEGCAPELDPFWGNKNIRDIFLKYRFEEHSASHAGSCLKKDVNVGFYFHSCHLLIHTYMRIEVTTTITTLHDIVWMEVSTMYIHLWLSSKDPWDVNTSILIMRQFLKFSIATQTFKLETHHTYSTALCIQANQPKMKIVNNSYVLDVQSLKG